jgi:Formin Homology 2 Domain
VHNGGGGESAAVLQQPCQLAAPAACHPPLTPAPPSAHTACSLRAHCVLTLQVFASVDDIDTVLKCLPTADELLKLQPYLAGTRPISDLAPAELFILELAKLPQIDLRMSTFRYKYSIPESLESAFRVVTCKKKAVEQVRAHPCRSCIHALRSSTRELALAFMEASIATLCKQSSALQVRASECFSALLVGVLAVGNYLNLGTTNGAAVAFKLQALTKLGDTKSLDGDESLLSFLAATLLDAGHPPLAHEMPNVLSSAMETTLEVCSLACRACTVPCLGHRGSHHHWLCAPCNEAMHERHRSGAAHA